jgi:hypothetical protein
MLTLFTDLLLLHKVPMYVKLLLKHLRLVCDTSAMSDLEVLESQITTSLMNIRRHGNRTAEAYIQESTSL